MNSWGMGLFYPPLSSLKITSSRETHHEADGRLILESPSYFLQEGSLQVTLALRDPPICTYLNAALHGCLSVSTSLSSYLTFPTML